MLVLGYLLATIVGFSLGALGAGGAILAIPIFIYVWKFQNKEAIASAFVIVAIVGLLSAWKHFKDGHVNFKLLCIFAPTTMLGAYVGVIFSQKVAPSIQLMMLAVIMIFSALLMLLPHPNTPVEHKDFFDETSPLKTPVSFLTLAMGLMVGIMVGLVGVGSGLIMLPLMVTVFHVPLRQAIGTTLVISVMNAAVGAFSSLQYTHIPWELVMPFAGIALMGGLTGAYMNTRMPLGLLRRALSVVMLAAAGAMIYENLSFMPGRQLIGAMVSQVSHR